MIVKGAKVPRMIIVWWKKKSIFYIGSTCWCAIKQMLYTLERLYESIYGTIKDILEKTKYGFKIQERSYANEN